ncbi:hypothetical protein QZM42_18680 [Burkholderia vietnamiensis]|uniref:hypothetical protein n=1 Tax=Burkholderia vietnamiensis TaxID=60552 RepID=UPI002655B060|nr:hypothetical protein [Burkholderia vietnamiensis]MDN7410569.1 hypothetical protein [Burkholderia vietnamiensis]
MRPKNEIKTYDTRLKLTKDTKQKLADLALKTKKTNSELVESLVNTLEKDLAVYENLDYIKSREQIFFEVAKMAVELKQAQSILTDEIQEARRSITQFNIQVMEVESTVKEYRDDVIKTQNKLAEHFKTQTSLMNDIKSFIEKMAKNPIKTILGKN